MFKRVFIGGLLSVFLFYANGPVLALSLGLMEEKEVIDVRDIQIATTTNKLFPIKVIEPEEEKEAPAGILAIPAVIPDEEPAGMPLEELPDENRGMEKVAPEASPEPEAEPEPEAGSSGNTFIPAPQSVIEPQTEEEESDSGLLELKEEIKPELVAEKVDVDFQIEFNKQDVGASLDVCNIGPSCSGDAGKTHWMKEAGVRPDGMKLGLRFSANNPKINEGVLQVSHYSFDEFENNKVIYSKGITRGESLFDFSVLPTSNQTGLNLEANLNEQLSAEYSDFKPTLPSPKNEMSLIGKIFEKIKQVVLAPFNWVKKLFVKETLKVSETKFDVANLVINYSDFYLRVVPIRDGQVAGLASNEIKVSLAPPQEDMEIFAPAKIYEVSIKDFKPIRGPEPGVCNGAMILDTEWLRPKVGGGVEKLPVGTRLCPAPFKGIGEEAWYESLWNGIKSGVDWVSESYAKLKKSVVDTLADVACGGNEECRNQISIGLDAGLVALGIPPTLPNFDELMDDGLNYVASEIANQVGCTSPDCKELIKGQLENVIDSQKKTNPRCDAEEAHKIGVEPLCLPDGVRAHVDPLGTYRSAMLTLEIRRNYNEGPDTGLMGVPYRVYLGDIVHNDNWIGTKITNIPPHGKSVEITSALTGQAFTSRSINIPALEKGRSIDIPIVLIPAEYWVPGHQEAMGGWTTVTYGDNWYIPQYDDWWKLYYGGNITFQAAISGCDQSYGQASCFISQDSLSAVLPNGF